MPTSTSTASNPSFSQDRSSSSKTTQSSASEKRSQAQQPLLEPLNAPDLLQAHRGNTDRAFQAAVSAHNGLLGAEAERIRVVTENSKLWTWCSSLKKERDALVKDRTKLERKVAALQAFCKANGLEPPEDAEEDSTTSNLSSSTSRPTGPPRSRSGEVLLRENHSSRERPAARSVSSRSNTDSDASQKQQDAAAAAAAARDRGQTAATFSASTEPAHAAPTPTRSPNQGHALRRKASSVDLGNPHAGPTSPKQLSATDALHGSPAAPSRAPAPKYTLNGLDISHSPFAPAFPPTSSSSSSSPRRVSSIATSPTHNTRTGPNSLEDTQMPAMGGRRPTRSPSDSLAPSERLHAGLIHQQQQSAPHSGALTPRPHPNKSASLPTEQTEDSVESPETSDQSHTQSLRDFLQDSEEGPARATPSNLTPSSSMSSTAMLSSPEKERLPARTAQTKATSHLQELSRPPLKHALSNESQHSLVDRQRASSAPSPGSSGHQVPPDSSVPPAPAQRTTTLTTTTVTNFKLDPANLQHCKIRVGSSQIKVNDRSREVIQFSITVSLPLNTDASNGQSKGAAQWTVEKYYSDVLQLDAAVKSKNGRSVLRKIASVPDKSLFKDHAPSKSDMRKAVLQKYLRSLAAVDLESKEDVCQFLTTNVVVERNNPVANPAYKAGYLTKKGRIIGNWQTRYYALQGPHLDYYESQGGTHLGHIDVTGAQIGRQQTNRDVASGDTYRHAFLIRENRRSKATDLGTDVDHILCAESDSDRDEWVRVLAAWATGEYIQPPDTFLPSSDSNTAVPDTEIGHPTIPPATAPASAQPALQPRQASRDEGPRAATQTSAGPPSEAHMQKYFQNPFVANQERPSQPRHHQREDSAGRASLNSEGGAPAGDIDPPLQQRVLRKRNDQPHSDIPASSSLSSGLDSVAGVRPPSQQSHHGDNAPTAQSAQRPASPSKIATGKISGPMNGQPINAANFKSSKADRQNKTKSSFWNFARGDKHPAVVAVQRQPVFGVPLEEAVNRCRVREGFELPAVVFRCVEYLQAKEAVKEEGLYRLSGSNSVIKALKDKFNAEGDVDLLASGQYHDPHAVAGLLKLFLRELPENVLTRHLHPYFTRVVDLVERRDKVNELGALVAQLPVANYTLLRFLSSHLTHVIQNESINKMSLRNMGIVFSPTLVIPATLFNLFLTEFSLVFRTLDDQPAPVRLEDEEPEDDQSDSRVVSADMSVETITDASKNRRKSRNSQYYSLSGADRLLEPDAGYLAEADERAAEADEAAAAADSEPESQGSIHRSPLPSPTLAQGTAPSSVESDTDEAKMEALSPTHHAKPKALFVNTGGHTASTGLPSSPGSKFLSSPRHMTARPPQSPHSPRSPH